MTFIGLVLLCTICLPFIPFFEYAAKKLIDLIAWAIIQALGGRDK